MTWITVTKLLTISKLHFMMRTQLLLRMREHSCYTCCLLCKAWLFSAVVIFCHINAGIQDMLTERGHCTLRLRGFCKAGGIGTWRQVCICECAYRSRGMPVEQSMWMPTHSVASRPLSFCINLEPLNINRTGILKLRSSNRGNGIMHRP